MSAIVGKRTTSQNSPDSPKLPGRTKSAANFYYMHHPHRWQFDADAGEWFPQLGKMKLDPGVGGVTDNKGTDLAVAQATRRGWGVIRPNDERLAEFKFYTQEVPKAGRGRVFVDMHEGVEVIAGRAFWKEGGAAYRGFLRHLVSSGIIPPINDNVKRLEVEKQANRVDRLESNVASAPHNQVLVARLDTASKRLAAMKGQSTKKTIRKAAKPSPQVSI